MAVHEQTLGKYERNVRQPDAPFLTRLRDEFGVSADWLLTGEGQMLIGAAEAPAAPPEQASRVEIDEELHGRVVDGISRVHAEEGVRLPPVELGRIAARTYADLVNAYGDPDEQRVGLKLALEQLRRQLRAPIEPAQRKERA